MEESSYTYNKTHLSLLLKELKENPPEEIDSNTMGGYQNIVAKYMITRAALIHRANELAISSDTCIQNNQVISSKLLLRGLFETVSVIGFIYYKILDFNKTKNIDEFDKSITKIQFGSRDATTEYQTVSILTMIDKINKEIPSYRLAYDRLSEYSHPNFAGVLLSHSTPRNDKTIKFHSAEVNNNDAQNENINDLCMCINTLKSFVILTTKIIEEFVELVNKLEERE